MNFRFWGLIFGLFLMAGCDSNNYDANSPANNPSTQVPPAPEPAPEPVPEPVSEPEPEEVGNGPADPDGSSGNEPEPSDSGSSSGGTGSSSGSSSGGTSSGSSGGGTGSSSGSSGSGSSGGGEDNAQEESPEPEGEAPEPESEVPEPEPEEPPLPSESTGEPVGFHSAPPLPPILNPQVKVLGNTAVVTFEPVAGAKDYRIYPMPSPGAVQAGGGGQLTIANAIYRCGGDRQLSSRNPDYTRLAGWVQFYTRSEAESVLGHVFVTPGPGRVPVWRLSDPTGGAGGTAARGADNPSGFAYHESRAGHYVTSSLERQSLLNQGWRDEGVVFYAPTPSEQTVPVYSWESGPRGWTQNRKITVYFREGAEYDYRSQNDADPSEFRQPFSVLLAPEADTVPLHRIFYEGNHDHDILAAGEARKQRALQQGNQPVWFVSWPGLTGGTSLVVEALDQGCPFPGHIASEAVAPAGWAEGFITLDQARLGTGEVFINGQHHPSNQPKPIARAIVHAAPEAPPANVDFFEGFNANDTWDEFTLLSFEHNNGNYHYRSDRWDVDFSLTHPQVHTFGPLLGELVVGFADRDAGVNGRFRMSPRIDVSISASNYVHARMDVDIPTTGRRYPQIMISSVAAPIQGNLENGTTIVLHPFGINGTDGGLELQLQFCDHRTWDVNNHCPQSSLGTRRWGWSDTTDNRPQPLLGELAGFDRKVRFDVYASTQRVYVFVDDRPAGCAFLPEGRMQSGPVSVNFGAVLYHSGIDEMVIHGGPHQFLDRHGLTQTTRRFGNLMVNSNVSAPNWNYGIFPCGGSGDWIQF